MDGYSENKYVCSLQVSRGLDVHTYIHTIIRPQLLSFSFLPRDGGLHILQFLERD